MPDTVNNIARLVHRNWRYFFLFGRVIILLRSNNRRTNGGILPGVPRGHLLQIPSQSDHFRPIVLDARHRRREIGRRFHRHRSFRVHVFPSSSTTCLHDLCAITSDWMCCRDLSQSCAEFAVPSLCFAAFPLCEDQSGKPVPRQLCRDECEVLENDICRMEYAVAKQHPLIGEQVYPICFQVIRPILI